MKTLGFLSFLLFSVLSANAQTINAEKSHVKFSIPGLGKKTVEGVFTGMSGNISFSVHNIANASFNVCVNPATVNTEKEKRDKHLRNEDFFFVEKFSEICFVSTSVSKTPNGYIAKGKLTILGVTKEVEIPFTFEKNTFIGKIEVNRFDYGLAAESYKKTRMVGAIASVEIVCVVE